MKINGKPDGGGGGGGVITSLSVSVNGTYTAGAGIDGYSPVEVSVPDQKPEETFNVTPSTTEQTITPQEGYVFTSGVVGAVTSSIDANIQAGNIKSGVTILGVEGNYTAPAPVTESLSVSINGTYTPGQGVDGFSQVVVDVQGGISEKDYTQNTFQIYNLNNSAIYVASSRFKDYSYLQNVYLYACLKVYADAFKSCSNLMNINLPVCKDIEYSAFTYCRTLSNVYLPMVEKMSGYTFSNCSSLESIELPLLSQLFYGVFKSCSALTTVSIPICNLISGSAFDGCLNLSTLTLPSCSVIKENFNFRSTILNKITLGYSGLCTLNSTDAFTDTPIASGTGSIYVPASLVDAYKSAQNWSAFSSQIFPISSPVIVGYYFSYTPTNLSGMMQPRGIWENISSYNGLYNDNNWNGEIYDEAFYDAQNSTTISFVSFETNANSVNPYAFSNCTTLTTVRFTNLSEGVYVQDYAFDGCTSLSTVYVSLQDFTAIFDPDAFAGTPLVNGSGSIYVPSAVYNDYLQECADAPFVTRFVSY